MDTKKLRQKILDLAIHGKLVPPACRQAGKTLTMNPEPPIKGKKCWFTYVIECEDGSFYKGYTDNLFRRYKQHCDGNGAEYTKKHKPKQLYYWEMHYTQENALNREKYLKSGIGREWFKREVIDKPENFEPASVLLERIRAEKERLVKEGKIKKSKASKTSDTPHYENVPFEVPSSWVWTTLQNISTIIGDGLHGTPQYDSFGDYYFINGNNLSEHKIKIKEDTKRVSENEYLKYRKPLNETSILVSINGTIGNVGTYNSERVILGKSACYFNISPLLHKVYFCYLLESDYFLKYAFESATGSTIKNVPLKAMNDFFVPLPPLAEQQRIIAEIEKRGSLINQIEQGKTDLQAVIKQAKSKILDLAIHGKLVPQDPADEPASELLKRINPDAEITCDNGQYGKMPEGWCETILGELFEHNTGKALNSSNQGGIMRDYLTTSNVYWDTFDLSVVKQMLFKENELEKCIVVKGDLLVCEGGDVGRSAIWNQDYDICIQNHLHRLRPKAELSVRFYYHVLKYLKDNNMIGGKGIGLLGLSSKELHKLPFPLPPYNEQQRIVNKIEELFTLLDNIQKALEV